jgi:hypothetical protein
MDLDFGQIVGGIEDGMMAALEAAVGVKSEGGYVKTIASYAGEMDRDTLKHAVDELTPRMPLLLIAYGDGKDVEDPATVPIGGLPRFFRHDCTFTAICVSDDARGDKARRRGTAGGVGVYKMIADVRSVLGGKVFSVTDDGDTIYLNQDPLQYSGVEYLARLPDLTAYACHFDTWLRFSEPDRTQPGQLVQELTLSINPLNPETNETNLPGVSIG